MTVNVKLPSLLFDPLEEIMTTRGYTFNTDMEGIGEYHIENVKSNAAPSSGQEFTFDVKIVLEAGEDSDFLEDTDFLEALNNEFVIENIDYNDIENNRREVIYSLLQAY